MTISDRMESNATVRMLSISLQGDTEFGGGPLEVIGFIRGNIAIYCVE